MPVTMTAYPTVWLLIGNFIAGWDEIRVTSVATAMC